MERTDKKIYGVFAEKHGGKTTLVKKLSEEIWRMRGQPTLALDPYASLTGKHIWSTKNEKDFREAVEKRTHCLVVIEDASSTIQRDREFTPFFTCISHNFHDLIVVGHDATNLLPEMRQNFDELFLFNQTKRSVEHWQAAQPSMKGIELSTGLDRYQFVHCIKFAKQQPTVQKLAL